MPKELIFVVLSMAVASSEYNCSASLYFPTLTGNTISGRANAAIDVPVRINFSKSCSEEAKNYGLQIDTYVYRSDERRRYFQGACVFLVNYDGCIWQSGGICLCDSESELFIFNIMLIFDERFHGSLVFESFLPWLNISVPTELHLDIESKPRVTGLAFRYPSASNTSGILPTVVERGMTLDVVCTWENSAPPTTLYLLDGHGEELNNTQNDGTLRYTLSQAGCDDSGEYRCEAPEARENKTATLLVKCPPSIKFPSKEIVTACGSDLEIKINVRSYTRNFTDGLIRRYRTQTSEPPVQCDVKRLTGNPPDMTLTVLFDDVTLAEDGDWELELSNDEGTGREEFLLTVQRFGYVPDVSLPQNQVIVKSETNLELIFNVMSHTTNMTDCRLEKVFRTQNSRGHFQCDLANLTGTPPDLLLTVILDNVREEDAGVWRLKLTNCAGTAHTDLLLSVQPATASFFRGSVFIAGISSLSGAFAVAMVVYPVLLVCRRCRHKRWSHRQKAQLERRSTDDRGFGRMRDPDCRPDGVELPQDDTASDQHSEYYMEIQDDDIYSVVEPDPPKPCPRRVLRDALQRVLSPGREDSRDDDVQNPLRGNCLCPQSNKKPTSAKMHREIDKASSFAEVLSADHDSFSDGYLTPRPLGKNAEEDVPVGGSSEATKPGSETDLDGEYLSPVAHRDDCSKPRPLRKKTGDKASVGGLVRTPPEPGTDSHGTYLTPAAHRDDCPEPRPLRKKIGARASTGGSATPGSETDRHGTYLSPVAHRGSYRKPRPLRRRDAKRVPPVATAAAACETRSPLSEKFDVEGENYENINLQPLVSETVPGGCSGITPSANVDSTIEVGNIYENFGQSH